MSQIWQIYLCKLFGGEDEEDEENVIKAEEVKFVQEVIACDASPVAMF